MSTVRQPEPTQEISMRRFIFWATVASGAVAAYVMLRRGEPLGQVAEKAIKHPVGSLIDEMKSPAA